MTMSDSTGTTGSASSSGHANTVQPVTDWTDLGQEMWAYLTGKGAAVNYQFVDMAVEVPRDTGPEAPRATWKLNGTLRITTSDDERPGADTHRG